MDLWIRTQDRKHLIKKNEYDLTIYHNENSDPYRIINNKDISLYLGTYKTEERALEVLDEMQSHIEKYNTITAELDEDGEVVNESHSKIVYEMPKE